MPVDISTPLLQDGEEGEDPSITMSHLDGDDLPKESSVNGDLQTSDGSVDTFGNPSLKSTSGGWKACPFILGNEFCERLAYYGINTNLVVYLTRIMHQGNAEAARSVTNWSGTCYITTFVGAFIADSYWGRYWTIAVLSVVYAVGMVFLTLSASLPSLKPPPCVDVANCQSASTLQIWFFYTALYLIALGTGGIKPCVSSFGADQFDSGDPVEKKHMTSFFNWFYMSINVGALIASSLLVYVQENIGWGLGFGLPTVTMMVAIAAFFLGTPLYRNQKPGGSPFTRIVQVLVAACRKWRTRVPNDPRMLYEVPDKESAIQGSRKIEHTPGFSFLDKAASIDDPSHFVRSPWSLCTVTQVEEVKIFARLVPIWASTIVYWTVYSQMSTFFVEQGQMMDSRMWKGFSIPAASLSAFDTLTIVVCVPIYDRLLVPLVRKYTGIQQGFTTIQRMAIGLWLATSAMVVAAIVESRRLGLATQYDLLDNPTDPAPMSILWQIPQYFLVGASEIFTSIGQMEFFYDQSPDAMRSMGSAVALSTVALGNFLSSFVVTVINNASRTHTNPGGWIPDNLNRGHLEYFFLVVALMSILNTLFYWVCTRKYKYKRVSQSSDSCNA